jgi:hypothetical protein
MELERKEYYLKECITQENWTRNEKVGSLYIVVACTLKSILRFRKFKRFIVVEQNESIDVENNPMEYQCIEAACNGSFLNLSEPQLILSVTGCASSLKFDEDIKSALKIGLMKAAHTANAWIITGGTDCGVMQLVGDAVDEDLRVRDLTVLGIATYGKTYDNHKLHFKLMVMLLIIARLQRIVMSA